MKINKILLNIVKVLLYSVPLIMLYVDGNLLYPFISGKAYLFRAIIGTALIFYLFLVTRDRNYLPNLKNPLVIAVSAFFVALTFTALKGLDWHRSLFGTLERSEGLFHLFHYYIFLLLIVSVFKKRKDWEIIMGAYVLSVLAMTIYSWFNGFWARDLSDINNTIYGTAGHKVYYGVALLFAIFFSLYFLFVKKLKSQSVVWYKLIYYIIILFCLGIFLVSMIMSKARGALLGLSIGIFLSSVIFLLFGYKKNKYYKIIVITVMLFIIIMVGIIFAFKDGPLLYDNGIVHRYLGFSPSADKTLYDQTLQTRFWTWGSAWKGIKERPIMGWGLDNFSFVFDKYFDVRHYFGPGSETWFDHPHNIFIEYWILGGIGGIILYIAIFISAIYILVKKIYVKKRYLSIWVMGFLSAYFIQNFFSFDVIYSYLGLCLLLGIIYFFSHNKNINIENSRKKISSWGYVILTILSIGILIFMYGSSYKPYVSNHILSKELSLIDQKNYTEAERVLDMNISYRSQFVISDVRKLTAGKIIDNNNKEHSDEYIKFLIKTTNELEKDQVRHSFDVRVTIALGKLYRDIAEISEDNELYIKSEHYFNKALAINKYRPEAIFGIARTYMLQKKYQKAIEAIEVFLEKSPQDNYAHFMLGAIYDEMGDEEKAKVEYKKAELLINE